MFLRGKDERKTKKVAVKPILEQTREKLEQLVMQRSCRIRRSGVEDKFVKDIKYQIRRSSLPGVGNAACTAFQILEVS